MKIINLLPKVRQEELRYAHIFQSVVVVLWLSAVSFLAVFGLQLGVKIYLEREKNNVAQEIQILKSQVSKAENEQIKRKITELNNYIADYKTLATVPKWSRVLQVFSELPPVEVGVSSLNIDVKTKMVRINGYAPTRQKVIELYNSILSAEGKFYGIDYPLENVALPTDNNFHFSFFIEDELLQ